MYHSDAVENAITVVHTVENKSVGGLAFLRCRQTVRAKSSTVDGNGENIAPLLSSHGARMSACGQWERQGTRHWLME